MATAAQTLEIEAPDQQSARTFSLLINFCRLKQAFAVKQECKELSLQTAHGTVLKGHNTISRYIASNSSVANQLLGHTAVDQALVSLLSMSAWCSWTLLLAEG